jgi:hypothetical protein
MNGISQDKIGTSGTTVVVPAETEYLDKFIYIQKRNIRYYVVFSFGLALLGFAFIGVALYYPTEYLKFALGLGGSFISSLSGLRIKDIIKCKNKIDTYRSMKEHWSRIRSDADKERFKEMVWKVLEQSAVG